MLGYDFEIIYKMGNKNVVGDALSRKEEDIEGLLCDISLPQYVWVEVERIERKYNQKACKIIHIEEDPSAPHKFLWKNDLLWYQDRLYLCTYSQLKKIFLELHTSPIGGYSGFLNTYHMMKKGFFLEGFKYDVQNFVAKCLVFQQNKGGTIKTNH